MNGDTLVWPIELQLVTGGSRASAAVVTLLASHGAKVVVNYLSDEQRGFRSRCRGACARR